VDTTYAQGYRQLYERHWWWRSRTEFILKTLRALPASRIRNQILDIGCGDALFFQHLSEFGDVEGVEPSAELVSRDNPYRDRIHFCAFDEAFQPAKRYSLILMLDVLEHLQNPAAALTHVLEMLTDDGTVIITVPAFMTLWTNHDILNHHLTRYTKRTFRLVSEQAGLHIHEERYLYHWTYPAKLLERGIQRLLGSKPRPPQIPANIINNALLWLSRTEEKAFGRLSLPFGSSLLIVGSNARTASS
jgi:SAM-dependent methyltransferase